MFDLDTTPLYCIHIPNQKDREENMVKQLDYFRPDKNYTIFTGERRHPGSEGVSISFKNVITEANRKNYERVMVFEDDILFTSPNSKEYMQGAITTLPNDWDIVLGCSYGYEGDVYNDCWYKATSFSSFICVIFNKSVYDKMLKHDVTEFNHIDAYMSSMCGELNVYVINPMVCKQVDGVFSNTKGKKVDYSDKISRYNILK